MVFGLFKKPKKDKYEGSDRVSWSVVKDVFRDMEPGFIENDDRMYKRLTQDQVKDFVYKHHTSQWKMPYKKETADCDDHAYVAKADIIKGQIEENFESPFLFGLTTVRLRSGLVHKLNFTVASDGTLMFYEPQTKKWWEKGDFENVAEVKKVDY